MEVKNVSETPFLFGFASSATEPEPLVGEFASVLAEVSESGTSLSTKAEVAGTEPNALLQLLDSPELGQGNSETDLELTGHRMEPSLVDLASVPVVRTHAIIESSGSLPTSPVQVSPEQFRGVPLRTVDALQHFDAIPINFHSDHEIALDGFSSGPFSSAVSPTTTQHGEAVVIGAFDSLDKDLEGTEGTPVIEKHEVLREAAPLDAGVEFPAPTTEYLVNQSIRLENDQPTAQSTKQSIAQRPDLPTELAGDLWSLIQAEHLRASLPTDGNQQVKVLLPSSFHHENLSNRRVTYQTLFKSGLGTAKDAALVSPTVDGGLLEKESNDPLVPLSRDSIMEPGLYSLPGTDRQPNLWIEAPIADPVKVSAKPIGLSNDTAALLVSNEKSQATITEISAALRIVGIDFSQESILEPLVAPAPASMVAEASPQESTAGRRLEPTRLPDKTAPIIDGEHTSAPAIGIGLKSHDSVRQAVAHTWAALQKESRVARDESVPLSLSRKASSGSTPQASINQDPAIAVTGSASKKSDAVSANAAPIEIEQPNDQNGLKVPGEDFREAGTIEGKPPTSDGGISLGPVSSPYGSDDESLVRSEVLPSSTTAPKIESGSEVRLRIEGNHALLEIRSETIRKVAEHLDRLLVTRSKAESVIRMQPEELGSITMVVRNIKNDIEAVVTASDDRVRELLHDSRQDLVQNLQQRGHSEVKVTVAAENSSADRQPSHRDSSQQQDQGQRFSSGSEFGSSSNGQSFAREQDRQGSNSNRLFRSDDERNPRSEPIPSKKSETFRRFQKVIDVAI